MSASIRSGLCRHEAGRTVWLRPWTRLAMAVIGGGAIGSVPAGAASQSDIVVNGRIARPFAEPPVADGALARMRGGVLLPNGVSIAIGIDIQTHVDGYLAVQTIYTTDGPDAGVRVFTGGATPSPVPPGTVTVASEEPDPASVSVSRSPTGTTIDVSTPQMPVKINLLSGLPSTWSTGAGQQVPVVANGPPVATPGGDISLSTDERGAVVTLQTPTLLVEQIVGQANGLIVSNTANDRMINTDSALSLDLHGLSPELSAGLAAGLSLGDQLALAVATNR